MYTCVHIQLYIYTRASCVSDTVFTRHVPEVNMHQAPYWQQAYEEAPVQSSLHVRLCQNLLMNPTIADSPSRNIDA